MPSHPSKDQLYGQHQWQERSHTGPDPLSLTSVLSSICLQSVVCIDVGEKTKESSDDLELHENERLFRDPDIGVLTHWFAILTDYMAIMNTYRDCEQLNPGSQGAWCVCVAKGTVYCILCKFRMAQGLKERPMEKHCCR